MKPSKSDEAIAIGLINVSHVYTTEQPNDVLGQISAAAAQRQPSSDIGGCTNTNAHVIRILKLNIKVMVDGST